MNKSAIIWIVVALVVIAGGWYWLSTPTAHAPSTAATPVLSVHTDPTLGTYLVAANGMTLYVDTQDSAGVSTCTGVCAANWPAYAVSTGATLTAGTGVTGAIGTIQGTSQLTYKGMPLYFWIKDAKPGDATGNNVGGFVFARP